MEETNNIMSIINIPTQELNSRSIQEVLIGVKKQSELHNNIEFWNEITQTLWTHVQNGFEKFDDQLLGATCFYTVLGLSDKEEMYSSLTSEIIKEEVQFRASENKCVTELRTMRAVSLMYGLFQSSCLTRVETIHSSSIENLLKTVFQLLSLMAYEYSKFTFIVFKTLYSFKKVCGTKFQEYLFSKENQMTLLNIVNHNWENPITGVRDLNKGIFQTLINVIDIKTFQMVLQEINGFYWNKAKYLMVAEIISQRNTTTANLSIQSGDWINALVSSLHKPGLVSAGADMYFALFKQLKSEEEWCKIFIQPILQLLCGSSKKGIEHLSNYWCLTTFKSYPSVAEIILNELENCLNADNKLYSYLCIMKQANKLGLIKKIWESKSYNNTQNIILDGLVHSNNEIRIMAFDILCVSNNCKTLPTKMEYECVLDFLNYNINSDCTVLRINMLKSLSSFLIRLHMSYLNYVQNIPETYEMQHFCSEFQSLIIKNLEVNGNYQRKVTCLKLAQTFLNDLKAVPRKRQKQTRNTNKTMIKMLKDEGKWLMSEEQMTMTLIKLLKDPAEDIRDNAGQLLFEHYSDEVEKEDVMNILIEDALKCLSSKFFYEISCGESMFKLIINILQQKKNVQAKFKTVNDVLSYALDQLITEYKSKRGIVESIKEGKQLHSYISILRTVLEVCSKNIEYHVSIENLNSLLEVLEGTSNQFAWEQETSTSSDFSKMSDMVQQIIATSGCDFTGENDETKISGLHQIVLNCLWLNVKASCELSSLLVKYQKDDTHIGLCEKALNIICHVLETCRHKGAIEATGAALGLSIQYLTSLPDENELSKLPFLFLKSKLNELISDAALMASVTRRGAGLSIMVHRIVSSDAKRGKPLYHYFIKTILETCNTVEDMPNELNGVQNIDNEKDLPKAIYIHFLTRIVTDSSLASDMMFYSADLAELAFDNITSPYWQIRNAALQLYGALIQKLIGQKKICGTDEETIATVACDELRTHSPKLWIHIQHQLKNVNYDSKIQYHSDLVPILNMLANIARRYNFSSDMLKQKVSDNEMLENLILILDSPIYTVRRLSAKCIFNLFSFDEIFHYLLNQNSQSENFLHGCLMLIANFKDFNGNQDVQQTKFNTLQMKYEDILNANQHSYLCKELFEGIFYDAETTINIQDTLAELAQNYRVPGVFLWANKRFEKYILRASSVMIPELLEIILKQNESEAYLEILLNKIDSERDITESVVLNVIVIAMNCKNKFNSSIVWKILYKIICQSNNLLSESLAVSEIFHHLEEIEISYKLRYMIPFAARVSTLGVEKGRPELISKIIESLTYPETAAEEMRYIAALANNEFGTELKRFSEEVKMMVIKSALILLQDEDEDIRIMSAKFYPLTIRLNKSLQPYICLCKMLEEKFLSNFLIESGIIRLKTELTQYLEKVCSKPKDEYNPFANDSSNIYLEVHVFRQLIENF